MASKRQLEGQVSRETADADDSSKRPRLPEPDGEGTSGLNIINQNPEDSEDNSSFEEDDSALEVEDACDRISRFPALVQDKVFGFLSINDKVRMARVCSSWSEAVFSTLPWSHVRLEVSEDCLNEEYLENINEMGINDVKVVQCSCKEKMETLLQELPSLSSLELSEAANANFLFEAVRDVEVSGLKSLRIDTSVDQQVLLPLPQLFRSFPNLQEFYFIGRVDSDLLEVMGRELPRLKSLSLCSNLPSFLLNFRGLENFSGLESLNLAFFNLETFENLTLLNRTLKRLRLSDCGVHEDGWALVLSQMSSLELVELYRCAPEITDSELQLVCVNLVNLEKFALTFESKSIQDGHLKSVAKLSSLQKLALGDFGAVTDEGTGALRNLPHLKGLKLESFDFTSRVMEPISQIPSLQELHLRGTSHGSAVLETLRRGSCKLKLLSLYDLEDIKGEDMAYVAEMSSLRELHLKHVSVGPTGMQLLSQGTFTLEVLGHSSCDVTVEGLMPLFERQTCLKSVSITERGIEDNFGIDFMRAILPNLEEWKVDTKVDDE